MKRAIIIIASAVVLLGLAAGAYWYFFLRGAHIAVAPAGSATLPSSGSVGANIAAGNTVTPGNPAGPIQTSARLVQISAGPVVPGEAVVDVVTPGTATASSSSDTLVRYIERTSGNVYAYSETHGTITRTSNRTVPGLQKALWHPSGTTAFVQYLSGNDFSTVNTYGLPENGLGGFFLPQNLADVSVASSSVLALASGADGSSATLYNPDGSRVKEVFSTPLSSLRIALSDTNQYFAFTKPSASLEGSAYSVSASGHFSRVAGPLTGLVALPSPSGAWMLVSSAASGVMHLSLVNTSTKESIPLPVATIADKCVWATDSSSAYCGVPVTPPTNYAYPDDWYQGAVSFSDRIWKIDVSGRYAQLVLDFSKETQKSLDGTAFSVDPNGQYLVFVNKNDATLWSYKL